MLRTPTLSTRLNPTQLNSSRPPHHPTLSLLSSGLVSAAFEILATEADCPSCVAAAALTLAAVGSFVALSLAVLLHFNRAQHSRKLWRPRAPTSLAQVSDPLSRLQSWLRLKCGRPPVDRERGAFRRPRADLSEPGRTRRILSHPLTVFHHASPADTIDGNSLLFLNRATGVNAFGKVRHEASPSLTIILTPHPHPHPHP